MQRTFRGGRFIALKLYICYKGNSTNYRGTISEFTDIKYIVQGTLLPESTEH
jgi:hypothetical protein